MQVVNNASDLSERAKAHLICKIYTNKHYKSLIINFFWITVVLVCERLLCQLHTCHAGLFGEQKRIRKMLVSAVESGVILSFTVFFFYSGLFQTVWSFWRAWDGEKPSTSLAVGDFFVSFLACPFGFSSAIARKWIWGHSGCIWYAFITTLVGLASIVQLAILAIERFVTLRSPIPNIVSTRQICQAILICWFLALLVSCLPLIGLSKYTFEGLELHCSIFWDIRSVDNLIFCLFLLIIFYLAPPGAILVSYVKIFLIVRRVYKNADRMWGREAQATKQSYVAQVKMTNNSFS
jgi:hypothetical protein